LLIVLKVITIIQARMGSQRLPGKVLLSLGNSSVLDYVVSRCQLIHCDEVIVATSTLPADDAIVEWCKQNQVAYFRGSEKDVLSRYYECAIGYQPDYIVRVTSDCPFVDYEQANQAIATARNTPADLIVFTEEQPRGLTIDFMSFAALESCYHNGKEAHHREHVNLYAFERTDLFSTIYCEINPLLKKPHLRITLDTIEDYEVCLRVAQEITDKLVPTVDVVAYLLQNPEVSAINASVIQKNV
jgi:spore coat polysaccharide biosynthesis protein SpsF